ncbi:hypothetical protein [Nonomuraea polychroma]|uniref:hypothetical protein n=1 Tax=Nonomuraea polychroma TaxID=46176 RepID=UPI0013E2D3C3|nr:hypothetical protein [Nonomuraea polychroma]
MRQHVGVAMLFQEGTQCRAGAVDLIARNEVQAHAVGEQINGQLTLGGECQFQGQALC